MQPEFISSLPQQKEFISLKQAIYYGVLFINGPVTLLIIGIPAATFFAFIYYKIPLFVMLIGFVVGFVLAWAWWSFATPRWRIWAMLRVENLYLLHKTAVKAQLTWPRDHLFEHTEVRTQLQDLQQKHIETRDLMNRFRYYLDYETTMDGSRRHQFLELRRCLTVFCIAAYSENKRKFDAGTLKYLIDQLRLVLKSHRMSLSDNEWQELIDLLINKLDIYQASIKQQILQ